MSRVPGKRRKPKKPYPSFPLTPHNNGQWCKKVRGKIHFFGVREDPDTALQNYLSVADGLHAGRRPHEESLSDEGPTVKDVCNHSLTHPIHRAEAGEISHRWHGEEVDGGQRQRRRILTQRTRRARRER